MNKAKLSQGKVSLAIILSLGTLVLGIGCIGWALINIRAQSVYSVDTDYIATSTPTAIEVKQITLIQADAVNMEPDPPSDKLTTDSEILPPNKVLYPVYPVEGESIGTLSIPVLNQELPIVQGTSADELKKGVGHFIQSVLPGEQDNCVLSGHRDTVFAKLGKLKIDDLLIVQTSAGTYTYEIKRIRIVDKDDKTVIVPTDHAVMTLTTCYPFDFVGYAPDRYILIADLVK